MTDDDILDRIVQREGGFVDHPKDKGKATKYGITRATLAEWLGRPVTVEDVQTLSVDVAKDIYRKRYLAPFADVEPIELREQVVDVAVNSGVSTARALLSRAVQRQDTRPIDVRLVIERLRFYARIVKQKPDQAVFLEGWINRAVSFL